MSGDFSIFTVSLLLSAALALWAAISAWRQGLGIGRHTLTLLMTAVFIWSLASFFGNLAASFSAKLIWYKLGYIGVCVTPVLFFILALELSIQQRWLSRRITLLLWPVPAISLLLIATNEWHHWFWAGIATIPDAPYLEFSAGPWFLVNTVYSYLLLGGSVLALARALLVYQKAFRFQAAIVLISASFPILANLMYLLGDRSTNQMDLTPHAFSLTGLVLIWAFNSAKFLNPLPVARERLLDLMNEAVIILDQQCRVSYLNPIARHLLNTTLDDATGSPASQVLMYWPYLAKRFSNAASANTEALEIQSQDQRWFDLRISPLFTSSHRLSGWLIILNEITNRKSIEFDLAALVNDLQSVAEISRVLTTTLDVQELLQKLVDLAETSFQLYFVQVYLLDEARQKLVLAAASGAVGRQLVAEKYELSLDQEPSLIARTARTRQGVIVNDVLTEPSFLAHPLFPKTRSELAVPLLFRNHLVGVLDVQDQQVGRFTEQDMNLYLTLAAQITASLNNARTFEQLQNLLQSRNKELELMYVMGKKISEGATVPELLIWTVSRLPYAMRFPEDCRTAIQYEGILYGSSEVIASPNQISVPIRITGLEKGKIVAAYPEGRAFSPEERSLLFHTAQSIQNFIVDETIHRQRTQLKETLEIAHIGHFEYDFATEKVLLSEELIDILGADPRPAAEDEVDLEFIEPFIFPQEFNQILEDLNRAVNITHAEVFEREVKFLRQTPEGPQIRHALFRARVERGREGEALRLIGNVQDITDRLKAEEQIRRLAAVIDQAKETIVITDPQGNIVYANPHFEEITGYSVSEALGKNPRLLKSGQQSPDFYENLWKTITAGKTWNGIFVNRRKDGSLFHEATTIFPILDSEGKILNFAAVKRDITAEVLAERKAREAIRQQSLLMEITLTALEKTDLHSMLQTLAERLCNLLQADGCFLMLVEEESGIPVTSAVTGVLCEIAEKMIKAEPGEITLLSAVLNSERALVVEDIYSSPYIGLLLAAKFPARFLIGLPLAASGQRLGVALLAYQQPRRLTEEEITYYERTAAQISLAIIKAWLVEEEQSQRKLAELMQATGQVLSSILEINQLLDLILDQIQQIVPYDSASLLLLEGEVVRTVRTRGYEKYGPEIMEQMSAVQFNLSETNSFSRIYKTHQPFIIHDAQDYPGWIPGPIPIRAWIGAPILTQEQVFGFISLQKDQPGFYRSHHAFRLAAFSGQVSLALQNARLFETARRRAAEAETLRLAAAAITSTLKLEEIIDLILEQLSVVVPYDSASVLFLEGNELVIVGGRGFANTEEVLGMRFPLEGNRPSAVVCRTRQPYILTDAQKAHTEFLRPPYNRIKSWLGVPLILQDRLTGMIALDSEKTNTFTPDHARLAAAYADQVAIALENARLFEQVQKLAITDPLTGLYNRRFFFAQAKAEFERSRRYQQALSIIMMDIDDFKKINDQYGHPIGDQVLQTIAQLCKENVREIDIVGRYGGEEFVILLPETPLVISQPSRPKTMPVSETSTPNWGAVAAAERLRSIIANTVIHTEEADLQVTVSLGVAEYSAEISSPEELLDLADQALYRAKHTGKNRVVYQ